MSLHTLSITYEEFTSPDQLMDDEANLIELAWKARENSYAPYSHFHV